MFRPVLECLKHVKSIWNNQICIGIQLRSNSYCNLQYKSSVFQMYRSLPLGALSQKGKTWESKHFIPDFPVVCASHTAHTVVCDVLLLYSDCCNASLYCISIPVTFQVHCCYAMRCCKIEFSEIIMNRMVFFMECYLRVEKWVIGSFEFLNKNI